MDISTLQSHLDIIWIIISAALVLFMQAGFTALESGLTQAKNTINVAVKNLTDFILSVLIFWGVGYALMFGSDVKGLIGSSGFALQGLDTPKDYAVFVFQATFAGTAATIVSGAVAERIRFLSYALISVVVTGVIYPVSGHWIWGEGGWLADKGMIDFAGSTVVHSLGGWVGLAGALVLGPRLGRFNRDGSSNKIAGHSLVLAVIGVLVLWFGWFGFNGGSTLAANASVAKIVANTMLAAAAGGVSCFFLSLWLSKGEIHIEKLLNGVIGGLVGITAGCAVVEPVGAVLIGFGAGLVVYWAEWMLLHWMSVDDPVNAIPAHAFCGVWGTLILVFVAPVERLPAGGVWQQFGVQFLGVTAVFAWSFGMGLLLFWGLRSFDFLRVSPDAEEMGLNIHEHGASSGLQETIAVMHNITHAQQAGDGDLTRRVPVEIGNESAPLAHVFNQFLGNYQSVIQAIKGDAGAFHQEAMILTESCRTMRSSAQHQGEQISEASAAITELAATARVIADDAAQMSLEAQKASKDSDHGKNVVLVSLQALTEIASEVENAAQEMTRLGHQTHEIGSILQTIQHIAKRTDILALNAAIEAEHAEQHGQGFRVVANEVRNLAQRTQASALDIEAILKQFQTRVTEAMQAIDTSRRHARAGADRTTEASTSLQAITSAVEAMAEMTARIAQASEEEGSVAANLSHNLTQINSIAQATAGDATEALNHSESVMALAEHLQQLMRRFRVENAAT